VCVIAGGINKPKEDKSKEIFEKLLEISEKILFVNGGTDKINTEENNKIHNLETEPLILNKDNLKIGFLGIGGVPDRSIKRKSEYPNTWNEALWSNNLLRKMSVDYNKLKIEKPDFYFFVSHSPPYGIADYSKKITLNELESAEDIEEQDIEEKRKSANPLHLGSKIIKEFVLKNKIQAHFFGHVHKEGGKIIKIKDITFVNISHLSTLPYKLTGRKFSIIQVNKENIDIEFRNVVNPNLDLENFLEVYL
jgi:Icc-related predicted phosphoesterase